MFAWNWREKGWRRTILSRNEMIGKGSFKEPFHVAIPKRTMMNRKCWIAHAFLQTFYCFTNNDKLSGATCQFFDLVKQVSWSDRKRTNVGPSCFDSKFLLRKWIWGNKSICDESKAFLMTFLIINRQNTFVKYAPGTRVGPGAVTKPNAVHKVFL